MEKSDTLNGLISSCRDSERGFGKAAKEVHDEGLRLRFTALAAQRAEFVDQLAKLVGTQGGAEGQDEPQEPGECRPETAGQVDDASLLAERESVEEMTARRFEEALAGDLSPQARAAVERQRLVVRETLLELRGLARARRAG